MKKLILSLFLTFLLTGNTFSAGSSGGNGNSGTDKTEYEKAVKLINSAKKK